MSLALRWLLLICSLLHVHVALVVLMILKANIRIRLVAVMLGCDHSSLVGVLGLKLILAAIIVIGTEIVRH